MSTNPVGTPAPSSGAAYVPGGTDVTVADGGTGASTTAGARTNLGFLSSRVTTQFDKTNATLTNVSGLALTLTAGATYVFRAHLFCDFGAGGGKMTVGGTATATAITWEPLTMFSDQTWGNGPIDRRTALGGSGTTLGLGTETPTVWVEGTIRQHWRHSHDSVCAGFGVRCVVGSRRLHPHR